MRFSLTIIFLDEQGRIVSRRESVRPRRIAFEPRARAALELPDDRASGHD